jgi:hypothetical protein
MHNADWKINMLVTIQSEFNEYFSYFILILIQFIFLLLPVNLKNWDDDLWNCITYIAMQCFIASVLFIITPWIFEMKELSVWQQIGLIGSISFIGLLRVIKLIPLEFTFTVKLDATKSPKLEFLDFFTPYRQRYLHSLDFTNYTGEMRYQDFREKLIRLKLKKSSNKSDSDEDDLDENNEES